MQISTIKAWTKLSSGRHNLQKNLPLSNKDQDKKSENKAPMIAGVSVGVVAGLASVAGGIAYLMK